MMKKSQFTVHLERPLQTARGRMTERSGFLVRIEHENTVGVGEATPLAGWTETYEECRGALDRARTVADHLDWGIALAKLEEPAARHAISLALVDARARSVSEPLYRSLPSKQSRSPAVGSVQQVPVNATIGGGDTPKTTATLAKAAVNDGFESLKLKVGTNGIEEDIERVRAVRNAVGEDVEVRVDANGAWTGAEAREAIESLAALEVAYVEQPLPAGELGGHASLRGGPVDIALDETLSIHDASTILNEEAADVLVIKPMVVGGVDRGREIARMAREAGVEPVISTTIDAAVARTGAVHLAASIPDVRPCGLATAKMLVTDLAADPAPVEDGYATVPQDNGIGVRPDLI